MVMPVGLIWIIVPTGIAGSLLKIMGGLVYGSNTLFVDALTSIANMFTLFTILWFRRLAYIPPDTDHHFGHEKYEYVGVMPTIIAYGFVAGVSVTRLYYVREYSVGVNAFYLALLAMMLYGIAIILSRNAPPSLRAYGVFTVSELIEGVVGIVASLGGALYSYLIDYGGAILLTLYIFYEIYEEGRKISSVIVDEAPPIDVYREVANIASSEGYMVKSLRLRTIVPGKYHGDMVVQRRRGEAGSSTTRLKNLLEEKGIDVCIEEAASEAS